MQAAPPAAQQQQQQQEEEPIWVRRERERAAQKEAGGSGDLPFGAYLLFSSFTAIAAVSILCSDTGLGLLGCMRACGHGWWKLEEQAWVRM